MKHIFRFLGECHNSGWVLREADMYHALKVIQLGEGDLFEIGDGKGKVATAKVLERRKREFLFEVLSEEFFESKKNSIDLFCAALKPGVFDDALPAAVELGVRNVFVFAQDRGEYKKINEKVRARWQRILDEALKQSKRPYQAELHVFESFAKAWSFSSESQINYDSKIMLDEKSDESTSGLSVEGSCALIVGSESGLLDNTRASATENGFRSVRIARHVLRSRTAIQAGMAIFGHMQLWQED
jgi:RsmE family RNA methyltransferase